MTRRAGKGGDVHHLPAVVCGDRPDTPRRATAPTQDAYDRPNRSDLIMHTANRSRHDVVVVGGRVAGSATAMLLARLGHDVVVADQATFPSDTPSTHAIARSGVVQLRRWGLLDEVLDSA